MARAVLTRRSRIVALLFSHLDNPFYALLLERLCAALRARGQHALVVMMPDTDRGEDETVERPLDYRGDATVTASVELPSRLCDECHAFGIPVVMLNRTQHDERLSAVPPDNMHGGRMAAAHLVERGRRRIALLAGRERASTNRDREFGFLAELDARGRSVHARAVGPFDLARTEEATRALFDRSARRRPDAAFVVDDHMGLRALSVLRSELGLRVPQDVAVIGFDDVPLAAVPEYDLTTLRQPIGAMVEHAVRIMDAAIGSPAAPPERLALTPALIRRGST
jgi:DNA-binding LacI/PurR family transcriptional regulator